MKLIKVLIASLTLIATLSFAKININTASVADFTHLKGIGEKKATAIIAYRKANGDFATVMDLVNVKGIGEKTVEKLKVDLTVSGKTDLTTLKNASTPSKKSSSAKPKAKKTKKSDTKKSTKKPEKKADKKKSKPKKTEATN